MEMSQIDGGFRVVVFIVGCNLSVNAFPCISGEGTDFLQIEPSKKLRFLNENCTCKMKSMMWHHENRTIVS